MLMLSINTKTSWNGANTGSLYVHTVMWQLICPKQVNWRPHLSPGWRRGRRCRGPSATSWPSVWAAGHSRRAASSSRGSSWGTPVNTRDMWDWLTCSLLRPWSLRVSSWPVLPSWGWSRSGSSVGWRRGRKSDGKVSLQSGNRNQFTRFIWVRSHSIMALYCDSPRQGSPCRSPGGCWDISPGPAASPPAAPPSSASSRECRAGWASTCSAWTRLSQTFVWCCPWLESMTVVIGSWEMWDNPTISCVCTNPNITITKYPVMSAAHTILSPRNKFDQI